MFSAINNFDKFLIQISRVGVRFNQTNISFEQRSHDTEDAGED